MTDPLIRYEDLTKDDISVLPSTFLELVTIIGGDPALKLCMNLGGTGIYFPKLDSLLRSIRNRKIKEAFDGSNHRHLALKYNLSEKAIRNILAGGSGDQQEELFSGAI